jgi:uncharacterized protein
MQVPPEVALIDACCMEDVRIEDLSQYSGHYFTTPRVLEEINKWISKERKPHVYNRDSRHSVGPNRPGYVHTIDQLFDVEEQLESCADTSIRKSLEYRAMELRETDEQNRRNGSGFFHAVRGFNYFHDNPSQVLQTPGGVDSTFRKYTQLLTKQIVVDVLKEHQHYTALERNQIGRVEDECQRVYQQRLADMGLTFEVSQDRKDKSEKAFGKILRRMKSKVDEGTWVSSQRRQFDRSIKTDAMVVQMAYQKRFEQGSEVCVYTKDRDVDELIDYVNAAKEKGAMRTTNDVRCYFAAQPPKRYAA